MHKHKLSAMSNAAAPACWAFLAFSRPLYDTSIQKIEYISIADDIFLRFIFNNFKNNERGE